MKKAIVINEQFTLSWEDAEGHINLRNYFNAKIARNQLAYLQNMGVNKINVGILQTRLIPVLEVKNGDLTCYGTIFDKPLDN